MKKKVVSLLLVFVLALGIITPALAYSTPDFTDVPAGNWAYDSVMRMADRGIVKGTGNKMFSPNGIATAEQFITLIGRIVFPNVKATGSDWSGPYVSEAKAKGLLEGTNVTDANLTGEISRYDMAVVLAKAVELLKVNATKADSSKVTDYGEVPTKYVDAVLTAYGSGLITGDENHNFNGQKSMRRNELATVMDRLLKLNGETSQGGTSTKPEPTNPPEAPSDTPMVTYTLNGELLWAQHVIGRPIDTKKTDLIDTPFKVYYTKDGGATSTLVYEGKTGNKPWGHGAPYGDEEGRFVCSIDLPEDAFSGSDQDQKGLYVSAETELDGQKLVTSDLRTDGRAYKTLFSLKAGTNYYIAELTPPDGEKAHFTFQGYVEGHIDGEHIKLPNFTIQMHLADGRLVNETVTAADGTFSMECEVDALDGGFSATKEIYFVTASGEYGGVTYKHKYNESLYTLHVRDEVGQDPINSNYRFLFIR